MGDISTHFSRSELQCKGSGELHLANGFIDELEQIRERWGKSIRINSACRSPAYNKQIGGAPKSFHLIKSSGMTGVDGCCAVDIATNGWSANDRWEFVRLAMELGWSVGVAKTFLHIDRRADYIGSAYHDQPMIFTY